MKKKEAKLPHEIRDFLIAARWQKIIHVLNRQNDRRS